MNLADRAFIGGLDANGRIMSQRMVGDALALRRAYATGRVSGGDGLAATAVVDVRSYVDGAPPPPFDALKDVDVHDGYHSAVMRARLLKSNGTAANHVMLTAATFGSPPLDARTERSPLNLVSTEALTQLDKWLTVIAADKSDKPKARKVIDNKPADLVDACYPTKAGPLIGAIEKVTDVDRCNALFPYAGDARLAAGAPATDDVFKCVLKAVNSPSPLKTAQVTTFVVCPTPGLP